MNTATLVVFLSPWVLWLGWEIALLVMRATQPEKPKTISMVARDLAWKCNSLVFLWSGLGAHWFWPSPTWATIPGAAVFWVIALLLGIADFALTIAAFEREAWPIWLKWLRFPFLWFLAGIPAGMFLFPQRGLFPWE